MEQARLFLAITLSLLVFLAWNTFFGGEPAQKQIENQTQITVEDTKNTGVKDFTPETPDTQVLVNTETVVRDEVVTRINTPLYEIELTDKGALVKSIKLKNFREENKDDSPLKEMVKTDKINENFLVKFERNTLFGLDNKFFKTQETEPVVSLSSGSQQIVYSWRSKDGIVLEKKFSFAADSYLIGYDLTIKNGSEKPINDNLLVQVRKELPPKKSGYGFEGVSMLINGKLDEVEVGDLEDRNKVSGTMKWVSVQDRYFMTSVIPVKEGASDVLMSYTDGVMTVKYATPTDDILPGQQKTLSYKLFSGPKSVSLLKKSGYDLDRAVDFGWFDILAKPCLMLMNKIYSIIPNYGIAIIILTILIKLVFWPLGSKSYKSMGQMKKLQPLMAEIREKYKNDKQRMNQETMSLYKTYKVNPMSGCLPMIVQMPIFFALYRMLYSAVELRHAPFFGWVTDLSAPDRLFHFDFAIPMMQAPTGIPVLTLVMGASMVLQQKMAPPAGDPTQARMMMIMPVFMTVIFVNFSSGLVLYWLVNNILSIAQQYYITKKNA